MGGIAESKYLGRWWHKLDDGRIQCDLCPRDCRLHEGQRGSVTCRIPDDRVGFADYEEAFAAESDAPETVRRRGLERPGGHLAGVISNVDEKVRVRIDPLHALERAGPPVRGPVDVEFRLERVVRERGSSQNRQREQRQRAEESLHGWVSRTAGGAKRSAPVV